MHNLACHLLAAATGLFLGAQHPAIPKTSPRPPITALTVTPDGQALLVGSQSGVFFHGPDRAPEQAIATELEHVHHLAFSPDGSLLAVAGGSPAEFGLVELWSWPARRRVHLIEGHGDVVYAAEWLGDSKTLVTAAADRTVRVWKAQTGQRVATLTGHSGPVLCLAVSPDSKLICSGSADQTIRVWETTTWQLVRPLTNHLGPVQALAFRSRSPAADDPHPSLLASAGGDGTVRVWQPEIGRMVRIVPQSSAVLSLGWDSTQVLHCGCKDGRVRAIDADTGEVVREEYRSSGGITSLAVHPRSHQLSIGDLQGNIATFPAGSDRR